MRVVNDLVDLRSKDEISIEYGPVRYKKQGRAGFTPQSELINGRIAMAAITAASALSINEGTFWGEVLEGKLPFGWW